MQPDETVAAPTCTQDDNCRVAGHPRGEHNLMQPGDWSLIAQPCPASIYLMGTVVNCNRPAGHDKPEGQLIAPTMHRIVIEWKAG